MQYPTQIIRSLLVGVVAMACIFAVPTTALSKDDSAGPLGPLEWGVSHQDVLDYHDELLLEQFREKREGVRDTLRVDRLRKAMRDQSKEYAETWETFNKTRTGYETSAISRELKGNMNLGMLTIRSEESMKYYVFQNDELVKIIVPINVASLDFMPFHSFVNELKSTYGQPVNVDEVKDKYGVPTTIAAKWNRDETVVRVENRRSIYNTYLHVFADANWQDNAYQSGTSADLAYQRSTSGVGAMMKQYESSGSDNKDIVDEVLGQSTEVHIRLKSDAKEGEKTTSTTGGGSAMSDDAVIKEKEQKKRRAPSRQQTPSQSNGSEGSGDSGGGMTIY